MCNLSNEKRTRPSDNVIEEMLGINFTNLAISVVMPGSLSTPSTWISSERKVCFDQVSPSVQLYLGREKGGGREKGKGVILCYNHDSPRKVQIATRGLKNSFEKRHLPSCFKEQLDFLQGK